MRSQCKKNTVKQLLIISLLVPYLFFLPCAIRYIIAHLQNKPYTYTMKSTDIEFDDKLRIVDEDVDIDGDLVDESWDKDAERSTIPPDSIGPIVLPIFRW